MPSDQWERLKLIFQEASEKSPEERAKYLDDACAGDLAMREQVESLLASQNEASKFISDPIEFMSSQITKEIHTQETSYERLGPYRIDREINRGGMGVVYHAIRDDDVYQKQVAIKVLKRGMDTDDIIRRFQQERQTLANLDHINITRLLDGGSTKDNLPYFPAQQAANFNYKITNVTIQV